MNLHLIACWAQKAANWQDTFRGWTHTQKQIFSFKEDVCHLHLFHGFRSKSIWHEENLIWLFIQIILPALIATLLPRGNHGQRETQGAMLLRPWIEAGSEYSGSRTPDWSDLSLMQAKNRECRTEAAVQVYQDYCLFNKVLFSPPIYFIKLSVHVWSNTSLLSQVYAYRIFWKSLNLKHESFCITQYPTVGIIYMRNFSWEKKTLNFPFY